MVGRLRTSCSYESSITVGVQSVLASVSIPTDRTAWCRRNLAWALLSSSVKQKCDWNLWDGLCNSESDSFLPVALMRSLVLKLPHSLFSLLPYVIKHIHSKGKCYQREWQFLLIPNVRITYLVVLYVGVHCLIVLESWEVINEPAVVQ